VEVLGGTNDYVAVGTGHLEIVVRITGEGLMRSKSLLSKFTCRLLGTSSIASVHAAKDTITRTFGGMEKSSIMSWGAARIFDRYSTCTLPKFYKEGAVLTGVSR
jgi:hypothetical protein